MTYLKVIGWFLYYLWISVKVNVTNSCALSLFVLMFFNR